MTASRSIPPGIRLLQAFEAVGRLGSFTKAASELRVTQSAVSHAVKELEFRLDKQLIVRGSQAMSMTHAGQSYYRTVVEALSILDLGERAIESHRQKKNVLSVSVSPTFAAKWLVPRLGDFSARYPDTDVRISADPRHINFLIDDIDIAVRHGDGNWPELQCTRLCKEYLFPVCTPDLAERIQKSGPRALINETLIHTPNDRRWALWLEKVGIDPSEMSGRKLFLNEMSLAIDAACTGQGVALVRSALGASFILDGSLARPFSECVAAEAAFWIVGPKRTLNDPRIEDFVEWMVNEAKAEHAKLFG